MNEILANPVTLEVILEVVKAVIGVLIPALTIALTFYTTRINSKLKRKTLKDEVYRLAQFAKDTQTFKSMNIDGQTDVLLESMRAFVIENDITISDAELKLMVERAIQSDNNLKMRFNLLDEKRSKE